MGKTGRDLGDGGLGRGRCGKSIYDRGEYIFLIYQFIIVITSMCASN